MCRLGWVMAEVTDGLSEIAVVINVLSCFILPLPPPPPLALDESTEKNAFRVLGCYGEETVGSSVYISIVKGLPAFLFHHNI